MDQLFVHGTRKKRWTADRGSLIQRVEEKERKGKRWYERTQWIRRKMDRNKKDKIRLCLLDTAHPTVQTHSYCSIFTSKCNELERDYASPSRNEQLGILRHSPRLYTRDFFLDPGWSRTSEWFRAFVGRIVRIDFPPFKTYKGQVSRASKFMSCV